MPVGLCLDMRPLGAVAFARSSRRPSKVAVRLGTGGRPATGAMGTTRSTDELVWGNLQVVSKKRHAP